MEIKISDFHYDLPQERIALHPLQERDQSKLLVYRDGEITHSSFKKIDTFLPSNAALFFNNTKVIPARLSFKKESGASIEIFILSPVAPSTLVYEAMQVTETSVWKCTIGNLKRWPDELELMHSFGKGELMAKLINRDEGLVAFSWTPITLTFAEVINQAGATPLPPYLKREANKEDRDRYQTVYSKADGAVAAPTAGLHFTKSILEQLKEKNIASHFLTLHVSAGTFLPVKVENALDHHMHAEQVLVTKEVIEALLQENKTVVSVGTTSMRTLESIYWYGVKLLTDKEADFIIHKMDAYELSHNIPKEKALKEVLDKIIKENVNFLSGETSIYIVPGYDFKICDALITNFHQPSSTLMLLVAAFIGEGWKKVYEQALAKEYRFLSYGDSSLLFRK